MASIDCGGGYTITLQSVLGSGAYGTVFSALRTFTPPQPSANAQASTASEVVAVKELVFGRFAEDEPSDLLKEIEILATIRCPFVVRYIASFFHDGCGPRLDVPSFRKPAEKGGLQFATSPSVCIVQERVKGGSVGDLLAALRSAASSTTAAEGSPIKGAVGQRLHAASDAAGTLTDEQISCVLVDVLHALDYLHRDSRIVHRDIKCTNILLSVDDGKCLLCDFGTGGKKETASEQRTTMIGTPGWMAPEVWNGTMAHSFAADVWTLGVTVLEMSMKSAPTLNPLFSQYVQTISHLSCSFAPRDPSGEGGGFVRQMPPSQLTPKFSDIESITNSPLLLDFVACCLRRDPSMRPSARDLLEHPLLLANGVSSSSLRKVAIVKRMADQLLSLTTPSNSPSKGADRPSGMPVGASGKPHTASASVAPLMNQVFHHGFDNAQRTHTTVQPRYDIARPEAFKTMWHSDAYRQATTTAASLAHSGSGPSSASGPAAGAAPGHVPPACGVFSDVVAPATTESRMTMHRIFSIYRSLGAAPHEHHDKAVTAHGGGSSSDPGQLYPLAALRSSELSFDQHEVMMDRLLRALHAVEHLPAEVDQLRSKQRRGRIDPATATESFSLRVCEWMTSFLLTNQEDADALRDTFQYFQDLQRNPFRHHHRSGPGHRSTIPPTASQQQGSEASLGARGNGDAQRSSKPLAEVLLSAPFIPTRTCESSVASVAAAKGPSVLKHLGGRAPEAAPATLLDPSAVLFNQWLAETKQKIWTQMS